MNKVIYILITALIGATCYFVGLGGGIVEGVSMGRVLMFRDVESALREGLDDGRDFYLGVDDENIIKDILLMPRADLKTVAYRRD